MHLGNLQENASGSPEIVHHGKLDNQSVSEDRHDGRDDRHEFQQFILWDLEEVKFID